MRIGILTGGGDAPGLNAVIRAVVKAAANQGIETIGIEDGFRGLIGPNLCRTLTLSDVTGILRQGGTILGTTNHGNPLSFPQPNGEMEDVSAACVERLGALSIDTLIAVGGDGTLAIAYEFHKRGVPIIGIPKTIDNDVVETAATVGFDTAVAIATAAVDRLHTTAEAHHRIMVLEVMGRYAGWIALHAGIAGGADIILLPEIPYTLERIAERVIMREKMGARFSIIVAAEGAAAVGGHYAIAEQGFGRCGRAAWWHRRAGSSGARATHGHGIAQRPAWASSARGRADQRRSHSGHTIWHDGGGACRCPATRHDGVQLRIEDHCRTARTRRGPDQAGAARLGYGPERARGRNRIRRLDWHAA